MGEYTPETLHRLWRIEMEIYEAIVGICEAHGLRYYAAYGTTLGAVRHQGFIPWDDDMDVCMPRKDYEEFIRVAPGELPEKMEIQGPGFTDGYVLSFIKIQNRNTTFVAETDQDLKYHTGIYVDIFPLDAVPPTQKLTEKQYKRYTMLSRACVLSVYGKPKLPPQMKGPARILARIGCEGIHLLLRLTGRTPEYFYRKIVRESRKYEGDGEPDAYRCLVFRRDEIHRRDALFPTRQVPFESITIQIPRDTDAYLTYMYKDYMTLPPPEKRRNHYPTVLDFGQEGESGEA